LNVDSTTVRILLVDDDEGLQLLLKRAGERYGYELVPVSDGRLVLELVEREKFDLIVLDINMPAMDGRDVLTRLKQNPATAATPVLIHSVRSGQLVRRAVLELGAADFIEKGNDARSSMAQVRRFVEKLQNRPPEGEPDR
jgi:CheY-like chemotaxis protein